jgi:sec-independent protein translocase protein TatA
MFGLGPGEMIVVAIIGLLLFGQRLPEVMRSLGKGMMEFKKGMRDIQDEFHAAADPTPSRPALRSEPQSAEPATTAPKFEPPPEEPADHPDSPSAMST